MAKMPWEEFQSAPAAEETGPWTEFAAAPAPKPFQPSLGGQRVVPEAMRPVAKPQPVTQAYPGMVAPPGASQVDVTRPVPAQQGQKMGSVEAFVGHAAETARAGIANPPEAVGSGIELAGDWLERLNGTAGKATNPLTQAVGQGFSDVFSAAKALGKNVREYQEDSNRLGQFELKKAGIDPSSKSAQAGQMVGSGASMVAKYSNPYGMTIALLENGVDATAKANREGFTPTQAAAKGVLTGATLAAMSALPGGEAAGKSLAGLIAKRGASAVAEGTGFVALDALVDKLVLDKTMTREQFQDAWMKSVIMMVALKGFGTVKEGQEVLRAGKVTKGYASWREAEDGIKGKIQAAHETLLDPSLPQAARQQAEKDIAQHWQDLHTLDYAKKANMKFTGKSEDAKAADEAKAALAEPALKQSTFKGTRKGTMEGREADVDAEVAKALKDFAPKVAGTPTPKRSKEDLYADMEVPTSMEEAQAKQQAAQLRAEHPVEAIRPALAPQQQAAFDTDMAPFAEREAQNQQALEDLQGRYDAVLKKARNVAYAQKGKKAKDTDIQQVLRNDPKILAELREIQAQHEQITITHDATQQAKEATADRWRQQLPPKETQNATGQGPVQGVDQREYPAGDQGGQAPGPGPGDRPAQGGPAPQEEGPAQAVAAPVEDDGHPAHARDVFPAPDAPEGAPSPEIPNPERQKAGLDPTPDQTVPEKLQDVPGIQVAGDVFTLPTSSLYADPVRFQYKKQNETTGVRQVDAKTGASGALHGVKVWNEQSAGELDVWRDPADGKVYVVNGHNRYGKALDLNVPRLKVRFIDVPDAKSALIFGARKNLAEGNGTALDAATYFRESGATAKDLEAQGIPVDKGIVKDGLALAGLPDTWFEAAANDPEILRLAVETGKAGLKGKQADTAFKELHDLLARRGGDAGEISSSYWKDLVDRIKGTQDLHTGEVNMFGEEETTSTLAEQTDLIRHIQGKLGAEKQAGTVLTGKRYSEAVGKAATVDAAGAGTMKAEANQALAHFKQQKNLTGIGDIINEHAARLAQAGSAKEADAIRSDALEAVREQIRQDLAGGEQADRPGSGAVDSGGAPSLFGEETGDGQVKPAGEVKPEPTARAKKQLPPKKGESTPAETREAYKAPVQAVITDPAARAAIYKDPEVQDVIAQISEPETDPFVASRGAVGARKQVKVPGGEKGRNILARAANHIIESMKDTVGDMLRPLTRGAQGTAQKNIAQALADHGQLQLLQGKDGALADLAHSMIEPTLPEGPDLKAGEVSQYALSPHNLGPLARAFTVDWLKASLDRLMKQAAGTFWARDVLEGTPDASAYVQRAMSPIAKDILKTDAAIRPLDTARRKAQADVLRARRKAIRVETDKAEQALIRASLAKGGKGDRREDAKLTEDQLRAAMDKAESAPAVQSAKRALADFDQKNQAKFSALLEQRAGHYEKAKAQIQALAAKHADVRVSLLVDAGDVVPAWLKEIAKPEEIKTANRITEGMEKYRDALKERGIPVIDDPYLTWLLKPLDPERFADQSTPEGQTRIRQLLAFQHRQGSINLFPTAHGSLAAYIPTVSRKLADQPLLNKWSSNPYAQEANPLHAPKFGQWLGKTLGEMQNPKRAEVIDSVINAAKKLDILRDIAFSPRVAVKHLVKMGNLVGLHHSWLLPAAKDVALHYAQQAENLPLVRTAMKAMGVDPHRNDLTQALAATLMATKQVSRMLYEDPMVAEHETPILNKFVDPTARGMVMKANALGSKAINLGGYPVTAVEALENFTNIFASMRQGQAAGLKPMANIDATLLNILDYNYRSGPDAARYLKDRVMNTAFRFTMTPAKTLELQTKIIQKGLSGERDIYGSLETAHLIRHMVVIGTMVALAKKHGHDIMDDVARLPLVSKDWVKHMALSVYHMAQGHKEKADKNLKMAAGALGGAVQTSPTLGGSTDIYALAMAAKDHSLKPLLSTVSAVKQAKALFGKGAPRGYKDKAHYLTNSPTPGEEARREKMSEQKGAKILGPFKRAEREP